MSIAMPGSTVQECQCPAEQETVSSYGPEQIARLSTGQTYPERAMGLALKNQIYPWLGKALLSVDKGYGEQM